MHVCKLDIKLKAVTLLTGLKYLVSPLLSGTEEG